MISNEIPPHHPDSTKWYYIVWDQSELGTGVSITNVTWTVPSSFTVENTSEDGLTVGALIRINDSTSSGVHDFVCQIETDNDEVLHEVLRVEVSVKGH